ncbi:iron-sulfur cluster insertion protein ErpA [Phaeospirillum tilakii]|uniref:Iron-sulfur cluster insertion protein ErpA n=1 Tax=Phaeospirillum tilakii TaxID=741673 RepID=A0ABW5C9U1_9PROT
MSEAVSASAPSIGLTASAAERVRSLIAAEGKPDLRLRVSVSGGGCSGFQYGITLDDAVNEDDQLFEREGVEVVVDHTSLDLLNGAVVDFVEDLIGASFQIKNPNATSTCGCGNSFTV